MTTKKLTIKYWNSLSVDTKARAIKCVFPLMGNSLNYLVHEKPDPKSDTWWQLILKKVHIPSDNSHYKFIVNNTYYC